LLEVVEETAKFVAVMPLSVNDPRESAYITPPEEEAAWPVTEVKVVPVIAICISAKLAYITCPSEKVLMLENTELAIVT
jgi:hypothetical protein